MTDRAELARRLEDAANSFACGDYTAMDLEDREIPIHKILREAANELDRQAAALSAWDGGADVPAGASEEVLRRLVATLWIEFQRHIRPCEGFTFHPVYCDETAYAPVIEILRRFLTSALVSVKAAPSLTATEDTAIAAIRGSLRRLAQPVQVTEEMVERALDSWWGHASDKDAAEILKREDRSRMRAALEAALSAPARQTERK